MHTPAPGPIEFEDDGSCEPSLRGKMKNWSLREYMEMWPENWQGCESLDEARYED